MSKLFQTELQKPKPNTDIYVYGIKDSVFLLTDEEGVENFKPLQCTLRKNDFILSHLSL